MKVTSEERAPAGVAQGSGGRIDGIAIGILSGFNERREPLVVFPGNGEAVARVARSTVALVAEDAGCEIALMFENGDPSSPLIIGRIQQPRTQVGKPVVGGARVEIDGETLTLSAEREIVLRCGKASLTLTRAGKVLIRGAYLLSRSSGANRIKGGSVQIN